MNCQECNERQATLHFTKIINGEKTEVHLCEQCAQEKSELLMNGGSGFSINNLLAGLLNIGTDFQESPHEAFKHEEEVRCEHCHLSFSQFVQIGKFGCADCYETFKSQLNPILKRLHSGNAVHSGKIPKRIGGDLHLRKRLAEMKAELKEQIIKEEFEKAAEIRDQIRAVENQMIQAKEGGDLS